MPRMGGLTLLELLASLALLAILLAVALPAFSRLQASQQVTSATNALLTSLHLARSEAIRRGVRVSVCPSKDGQRCTPGVGYEQGWIVFVGPTAGAALSAGGPILYSRGPLPGTLTLQGNGSLRTHVSYLPSGETRQLSGALQMGRITACGAGHARAIIVNHVGRIRVETARC